MSHFYGGTNAEKIDRCLSLHHMKGKSVAQEVVTDSTTSLWLTPITFVVLSPLSHTHAQGLSRQGKTTLPHSARPSKGFPPRTTASAEGECKYPSSLCLQTHAGRIPWREISPHTSTNMEEGPLFFCRGNVQGVHVHPIRLHSPLRRRARGSSGALPASAGTGTGPPVKEAMLLPEVTAGLLEAAQLLSGE